MLWYLFCVLGAVAIVGAIALLIRKCNVDKSPDIVDDAVENAGVENHDQKTENAEEVQPESQTISGEIVERANPLSPTYDHIGYADASLSRRHSDGRDRVHFCEDSVFSGSHDSHRVQLCRKKNHITIKFANNAHRIEIPMISSDGKIYRGIYVDDIFARDRFRDIGDSTLPAVPTIYRRTSVDTFESEESSTNDSLKTIVSGESRME